MIAKLTGILDSTGDDWAVIDVNGVGYLIFCSARTLSRFPGVGEAVRVDVETHVREDHIHLYGFSDGVEKDWFKLLTTVQGVGAKVGLAILSVLAPDQIMQAIAAQDKAAITRANGVGPKVATRILTELKDKAGAIALGAVAAQATQKAKSGSSPVDTSAAAIAEAASALVNLGYGRSDAFGVVATVAGNLGEGATVDILIREGLKELAPKGMS
jgi:Holliday junction DNA helicase RuvA